MDKTLPTLHYIFDPLCGWCYGAAPLVDAAHSVKGIQIMLHGGGMMVGSNRQPVTEALRRYVMPHDERIAQLSGQTFGADYVNGLLRDTQAVFDSEPPTTAILAVQSIEARGLDLLKRIQQAHYLEGQRVAERSVLQLLAQEIGIDGRAFEQAYTDASGTVTLDHIAETRSLLSQLGGGGFPTFALEHAGVFTLLEPGKYLGRPEDWQIHLQRLASPY